MDISGRKSFFCCALLVLACLATGCHGMSHAERGTLLGSGLGGLAGGIIGHQSGHTAGGALLGTLAGGLAGGIMGDAKDAREERDAIRAEAHFAEQSRRAAALALTNADLVKMSQARLGDDVIIQSVKNRGGRFDLSPDAMIQLKAAGVSERVILEVQKSGETASSSNVVTSGGTYIAPPPSRIVVVRPAASFGVVIGRPAPRPIIVHPGRRRGWGRRRYYRW